MVHQQSTGWRYISVEQAGEDFDKTHSALESNEMPWSPFYEYRLPSAGRLILAADFPVALLIGSSADECALGATRLIPNALKYYVRVKTRVILIDCLLVLGVFVQWWLVGRRVDRRSTIRGYAHAPVDHSDHSDHHRRACDGSDRLRTARRS
jgi:hypothetical protein